MISIHDFGKWRHCGACVGWGRSIYKQGKFTTRLVGRCLILYLSFLKPPIASPLSLLPSCSLANLSVICPSFSGFPPSTHTHTPSTLYPGKLWPCVMVGNCNDLWGASHFPLYPLSTLSSFPPLASPIFFPFPDSFILSHPPTYLLPFIFSYVYSFYPWLSLQKGGRIADIILHSNLSSQQPCKEG